MDTYEQKYKEALGRAKKIIGYYKTHNRSDETSIEDLESIFPELAESEDEKVRKELIKETKGSEVRLFETVTNDEFVAWLEKQGEHLENYDEAEKEKADFVGDGFIECHTDFLDFKEGNTYWLEYIGDDKYNVRSDNLLGKTYHITPCQLYTVFKKMTWLEKQGEKKSFDYKNQDTQNGHKFNIGDIISNGKVEFRVDNIVKNYIGQDCYFLVNIKSEKNGMRYFTIRDSEGNTHNAGETTWICEQVDAKFEKQEEQKTIDYAEELKKC